MVVYECVIELGHNIFSEDCSLIDLQNLLLPAKRVGSWFVNLQGTVRDDEREGKTKLCQRVLP